MNNIKGISVVIPNYNGATLLPEILPPLYEALGNINFSYEVIVSDDCSKDGSIIFLKQHYPEIIVLESSLNSGFPKTINKGIFTAKYDLVLLLNSDIKLTPTFFEKQLRYFEMPDTFGVASRVIGWDSEVIQDGGKLPSFHGVKFKTSGNYIPLNPSDNDRLYTSFMSGANAIVSREKLWQLGGFNEIFSPFYAEDFDLCLRAWRLGWKCYYEHAAVCRHKTSSTITSENRKKFIKKIYNRNKMLLHSIHLPHGKRMLWYLQLVLETLVQTIIGRFWFFEAFVSFIKLRYSVLQSRKQLVLSSLGKPVLPTKWVFDFVLNEITKIPHKVFK
jgi:GT2 family glycosyltransferase